jgi:hypothetical protein
MPNYGPSAALAVPVPEGMKELTPRQWVSAMKQRLREMQKQHPQDLLEREWEERTGESLALKDWGSLMDSLELQTRLMEKRLWMTEPIALKAEEAIPDEDMLVDPIDLIAEIS